MATDLEDIKKNWKEEEKFSKYVALLNKYSTNKQVEQQKKLTEFLRYTCESLKKHFKQWTSSNFFLGLFSNHHTARQVANVIIGRNRFDMLVYNDTSHNRIIHCSIF